MSIPQSFKTSLRCVVALLFAGACCVATPAAASELRGYYRFPAIHGERLVFTAEGDLWTVTTDGGVARRLTTHAASETHAAFSPDGEHIAFSARYEGSREVYFMPWRGGSPRRLTFQGEVATVRGFTPDGRVLYSTRHFSTLPDEQLVAVDPADGRHQRLPLAQASHGAMAPDGSLFFTRLAFQGSHTKRYRGGTVENLWRFRPGDAEAVPLSGDFEGTSRSPMLWQDRLYFASDRDGTMNLWSSDWAGEDLQQHSHHLGWDVLSPSHHGGRIVYQLGADLHLFDIASGVDQKLDITLASDFEQRRPRWVDEPSSYLTAAHLSPSGDRVALTARGQIFVVPVGQGRSVQATHTAARHRSARFSHPNRLLALSDASREVELWSFDPRGVKPHQQVTHDGQILRFDHLPSPDGRWTAMWDQNHELWLVDLNNGEQQRVAASPFFQFRGVAWSPDSRFLAYGMTGHNQLSQVWIHRLEDGTSEAVTSNRFDSYDPAWSPDGRWLYFLSDRHLEPLATSPWGSYQPSPLLTERSKIYQLALTLDRGSPFAAASELLPKTESPEAADGVTAVGEDGVKDGVKKGSGKGKAKGKEGAAATTPKVDIVWPGLASRLYEVPVPRGDYRGLRINQGHLFWLATPLGQPPEKASLQAVKIVRQDAKVKTLLKNVASFELSRNGNKLLAHRQSDDMDKSAALFVFDAVAKAPEPLAKHRLKLDDWTFHLDPREEWRQMFTDAWRLHRDHFYDPGMHGVDWPAMHDKYVPLVDRVTNRSELSDLFAQMVGELSALHHFVRRGDHRRGDDLNIHPASLGAVMERDEAAGGYRIVEIYNGDPDLPSRLAPLGRPDVDVDAGDLLLAINGRSVLTAPHPGDLLRHQAGRQTLLRVADADGGRPREVIVTPITPAELRDLRYADWEHKRRQRVEADSQGEIGYVHLRAMGGRDYESWARNYFPVANRQGLILDMRHNQGGNIDSWILGNLLRRPWMWWKGRTGMEYANMQFSFAGHVVVLCDEATASDGETLAEGFRRLGLGKVIGTRTWGGDIWLSMDNTLVDGGIASAAEYGVYGPEGIWLIEGEGVLPDIEVDNLPHATFEGQDAQLEAAIRHLEELIAKQPRRPPEPPPYPDKSSPDNRPGAIP